MSESEETRRRDGEEDTPPGCHGTMLLLSHPPLLALNKAVLLRPTSLIQPPQEKLCPPQLFALWTVLGSKLALGGQRPGYVTLSQFSPGLSFFLCLLGGLAKI